MKKLDLKQDDELCFISQEKKPVAWLLWLWHDL